MRMQLLMGVQFHPVGEQGGSMPVLFWEVGCGGRLAGREQCVSLMAGPGQGSGLGLHYTQLWPRLLLLLSVLSEGVGAALTMCLLGLLAQPAPQWPPEAQGRHPQHQLARRYEMSGMGRQQPPLPDNLFTEKRAACQFF